MRILILFVSLVLLPSLSIAQEKRALLEGWVSSAEEGKMEGVLVSAKKQGSNITVTVVTDAQGYYRFPDGKLTPGKYSLTVRAAGYQLEQLQAKSIVQIPAVKRVELKLTRAADLAAQLSNGEWMASMPGSDQQKGQLL